MYEIIKDQLAVDGIGEDEHPMRIPIPIGSTQDGWYLLDVRNLSDIGEENDIAHYVWRILEGVKLLNQEDTTTFPLKRKRVLVVCGAGQSRSNAIALGLLVANYDMDFYDAWELVKKQNPTCHIDPSHISHLKKIFGVTIP